MIDQTVAIKIREDGARVVKRNIEGIGDAAQTVERTLGFFKKALAAALASEAIRKIVEMTDKWTEMQNRLRVVADGQGNVNALMQDLIGISSRTRSSLGANVELFSRLAVAAKDLGTSQAEMLQFTERVNKAIKISGATAEESSAGLIQLSQGMASGTLRGDELNSVMEQLPAVADIISKSLGKTRGELRQMGQQGQITSAIILKAFREAGTELEEKFAKTVPTAAEGFVMLKDQLTITIGTMSDAVDGTHLLGGAISSLSQALKESTPELTNFGRAIAGSLGPQDEMSAGTKLLASTLVVLYGVLKAVASLLLGTVLLAFKTVGKIIGGVVAAAVAAISGDFTGAVQIVRNAMSDINHTVVTDSDAMANAAIGSTTDMFVKLNQIWDEGARDIQNRPIMGKVNTKAGEDKVSGKASAAELKKLETLKNQLRQLLDKIDPTEGALLEFDKALTTLNQSVAKGLITGKQMLTYLSTLKEHFRDLLDPLAAINREINKQSDLLSLSAREREVEAQVMSDVDALKKQGIVLDAAQTVALRDKLKVLQETNRLTSIEDGLLANTVQRQQDYVDQITTIKNLLGEGKGFNAKDANAAVVATDPQLFAGTQRAIDANLDSYRRMYSEIDDLRRTETISQAEADQLRLQTSMQMSQDLLALQLQTSQLQLQLGTGDWADAALVSLGRIQEGFTTLAAGSTQALGNLFTTFTDGFANAVGKAIVYSDNLNQALGNVAREAVAGLISALVKLGIQWLVNAALGESIATASQATSIATSVATGASIASAYAPAAALASLASFGANALPAAAAIAATTALSEAVALGSFQSGGYTGEGGLSQIAGVVHGKEFVMNAGATAANRPVLEAMNRGADVQSSGGGVSVHIQNYGTSKDFDVQQIDQNQIRIIARDEARAVVRNEAGNVVSAEISNPNSNVSKSLSRNVNSQRRR